MAPSPAKAAISSPLSKSLTPSVRSFDAERAQRPSEAYEFVSGRLTLAGRIGLKATRVEQSPSKFEISGLKPDELPVFAGAATHSEHVGAVHDYVSDLLIKGSDADGMVLPC
jgi:hypothetical protein